MHINTKRFFFCMHVSSCRYFGYSPARQERDQMAYYWKQIIDLEMHSHPRFLHSVFRSIRKTSN